jgi:hypothetical protein
MRGGADGYRSSMSDQQPRREQETEQRTEKVNREVPEGAHPTVNQPINAEPRGRFAPAVVTLLIVACIVMLILALTMI